MKYPTAWLSLVGLVSIPLSGCEDNWDHDRRGAADSEIVFGIDQTKTADGKVSTRVGYEFLDVRSHGWRARGVVNNDQRCWAERLDDRLGQPKVAGGVALFQGGLLPAGGVAVVANRGDDLKFDGPAWTTANDTLTFEAKGFAMPEIAPAKLGVPSTDLAILAPQATAEVAVGLEQELTIGWTSSAKDAPPESVVAALTAVPAATPGARGVELRCFFDRAQDFVFGFGIPRTISRRPAFVFPGQRAGMVRSAHARAIDAAQLRIPVSPRHPEGPPPHRPNRRSWRKGPLRKKRKGP